MTDQPTSRIKVSTEGYYVRGSTSSWLEKFDISTSTVGRLLVKSYREVTGVLF